MVLSENLRPLNGTLKSDSSDEEFDTKVQKSVHSSSPKIRNGFNLSLDDENNDDVERLARRKSRLLEPHPATTASPCAANNANRRRVDAAAPRGISPAQIGEHYGNCIRLAAENKITAKNAFNLHLIDFMSDMLKKEDYASFQIASSSLDAGAKIYAGRVDAVHQETYQVLTGLGRSDKPTVNDTNADNNENAENCTDGLPGLSRAEQRKKNQPHRDIIQKQLSKIRSKALMSKTDVDPLFQHQTSAYDEGGTADLRLNQLCTLDEGCVLVLDSSTRVIQVARPVQLDRQNIGNIVEHLHLLTPKLCTHLSLCPSLANFRFTEWDRNANTISGDLDSSASLHIKEKGDDEVFPMDDTLESDHYEGNNEQHSISGPPSPLTPNVDVAPNLDEASRAENVVNVTESELFVSSLKSMLDKQYEHFGQLNDHILGMWAGPEHWRKKAKRRRFDPATGVENATEAVDGNVPGETVHLEGKSRRCRRTKKITAPAVDYQAAKEQSENRTRNGHLARKVWSKSELTEVSPNSNSTGSSVFKEAYRLKASRQLNLLPTEWNDTRNTLYQLCNREIVLEANHHLPNSAAQLPVHLNESPRGFELAQSNPDFCTAIGLGDRNQENGYAVDPRRLSEELDELPGSPLGCDDDDDDDGPLPFDGVFTQATAGQDEMGAFGELDLISQPRKVARIEIGYARRAKMINVRRLKSAIWNFLESLVTPVAPMPAASRSPLSVASTSSAPDACSLPPSMAEDPTNGPTDAHVPSEPDLLAGHDPLNQKWPGGPVLSELISILPNRINWQMTKELSVPIIFNCLLHLSNEKELFLSCVDDFTDILISQGIPDTELEPLKCYQTAVGSSSPTHQGAINDPVKQPAGRKPKSNKRPRSTTTLDTWFADATPV